ncbi:hypothetical protein PoB_006545300 [Plakobranchus ocellatus]|uniref:Uncharacterized protein n=1 Tax=Plakobranchus ocellatus TaxID=259542 RepID=A0AAV4D4K4_9GAST|nr:hypothetical protein PoB_006545300 [Plakobranchus ocellatus]
MAERHASSTNNHQDNGHDSLPSGSSVSSLPIASRPQQTKRETRHRRDPFVKHVRFGGRSRIFISNLYLTVNKHNAVELE